jgi:hypothetical protein
MGETQHCVVKLPKSAGARHYCAKILRVPGTLGTHANSISVSNSSATTAYLPEHNIWTVTPFYILRLYLITDFLIEIRDLMYLIRVIFEV